MQKLQARRNDALTDLLAALPRNAASSGSAGARIGLLTATPSTPVARDLIARLPELAARGIELEAIFAQASSIGDGAEVVSKFEASYGPDAARTRLRVVRFAGARSLHEQVVFGESALWTGARIGDWRSRSFNEGEWVNVANDAASAQLARASFRAIWALSKPAPMALRQAYRQSRPATATA